MLEGSRAQLICLEFINEGSSIHSSDGSESSIRPRSTDGSESGIRPRPTDGSESGIRPRPTDGSESSIRPRPTDESESSIRSRSTDGYSKLTGNTREVCNNVQDPESGQPENDSALKGDGLQHPREAPSLTAPRVTAAPNGYCRFTGHGSIPEVCNDLQAPKSRQSEHDSTTESGTMPRLSHTESSNEKPRAKPSSVSYSRVIGDEDDLCNIVHDPESGHSESTSSDPGNMAHPSSRCSGKDSNKRNVFISGTSTLPSVFTMTHSNNYVLHVNAMSKEEETHASGFSILKPMDLAVDATAGERSENTLVLGHSCGSARQHDGERSKLSDHKTTGAVAERHELDYHTSAETAGGKFGFDYRGTNEIDDVYRSAETAGGSLGLGNNHRTTETDPERHVSLPNAILRAGSLSATSDISEGRTAVPADINPGQEISASGSDAGNSSFDGSPANGSALNKPSNQRIISGEDSGTTPSSLEYIQLTRFNCSDADN